MEVVALTVEEHMRISALPVDTREALLHLIATLQHLRPDLNRPGDYDQLLTTVERQPDLT